MNNDIPTPPPIIPTTPTSSTPPPPSPPPPRSSDSPPLGQQADDRVPITGLISAVEAVLRQPGRLLYHLNRPGRGRIVAFLVIIALFCSLVYGVIVGTFSGGSQLWIAPVKIAGGLMISALICLPSLFIFSCLSGAQAKLSEVFGLLTGLLALMTMLLIGFAPVAWVFSQSTDSVAAMGSLHLIFWFIATAFGLRFLCRGFAQLKAANSGALFMWIMIFLLVAVQMTTALRPIVGTAKTFLPTEKKFFLSHWGDCLTGESKRQADQPKRDYDR